MEKLINSINIEEGLNRLRGNKILYKKLLDSFFNGNLLEMLVTSIKNNDATSARMHAHSIKGAAANLALDQISETASLLENLLKIENAVITPECLDFFSELEKSFTETKEKLSGLEF